MGVATSLEHRVCPACEQDNAREPASRYSQDPWLIKACRRCGFVYLENAPVYDELRENLSWGDSYKQEKARRRAEEPALQYLNHKWIHFRKKHFRRDKLTALVARYVAPGKVCDVGCGRGKHLGLPDERYIPYGIELSTALAEQAREVVRDRGGVIINNTALAGLRELPPEEFTGIIMRAYLEHEVHPRPVLKAAWSVLQPQGRLIIKAPNFACVNRHIRGRRWCGLRLPDHVNYFTPRSLRSMLEEAGFTLVRMNPFDRPIISDNMWAVAEKRKMKNEK
jgi:2-polyprenyl-3-methyl-5-hydroxy-6-metoxy-1,4-benzoquinol methylase